MTDVNIYRIIDAFREGKKVEVREPKDFIAWELKRRRKVRNISELCYLFRLLNNRFFIDGAEVTDEV